MIMEKKIYKKPANSRPVVALSRKGEVIGYYESMRDAARMNDLCYSFIFKAIHQDMYVHGIRWMLEEEYRKYWYDGRTDELKYSPRQRNSDAMKKAWQRMSAETKERRARRISETKKLRGSEYMAGAVQARRKKVYCVTTGREYPSCREYADAIGVEPNKASAAIRAGKEVRGMLAVYRN